MRRHGHHIRDQKKLDTLKKKLHTDDECEWGGCEDVTCEGEGEGGNER